MNDALHHDLRHWHDEIRTRIERPPEVGTAAHIDESARMRGLRAVREGRSVSLARPVDPSLVLEEAASLTVAYEVEQHGSMTVATDAWRLDCHGTQLTHLDGLNHMGIDRQFVGDVGVEEIPEDDSIDRWAATGLITRAVLLDIPRVLDREWPAPGEPVGSETLEEARQAASLEIEPGDAALIYMGRDRFEEEGNTYRTTMASYDTGRPGLDRTAATWLLDHRISILCWDFHDAAGPGVTPFSVHSLIPLAGLLLVDNCDLRGARDAMVASDSATGMLVLAPLRVAGATGSPVNPILLL